MDSVAQERIETIVTEQYGEGLTVWPHVEVPSLSFTLSGKVGYCLAVG